MAQIITAGGAALSLFGGLGQGLGDSKQRRVQNAQEQQRIDLAERRVAMDEAYMRGKREVLAKFEQQEIAMLEMDFLQSEGLGNKNVLMDRRAQGGPSSGMQTPGGQQYQGPGTVQQQKASEDIQRWNKAFKGMPSQARGALLNDMAAVKDQQIEQQQFKGAQDLLLQKIQMFRGTDGQFEDVDEGLQAIRKLVTEAESPEELENANNLLEDLKAEGDQRASHKKAGEDFTGWLGGVQGPLPDKNNIGTNLGRSVARGEMTQTQAHWKYMEATDPEAFRASKEEVTRKEARIYAANARKENRTITEQAWKMTMDWYGDMRPESQEEFRKTLRDNEQYLRSGGNAPGGQPGPNVPRGTPGQQQPPPEVPGTFEEAWKQEQEREAGGGEQGPPASDLGFNVKADVEAMPGVESQQEYEGVLVQMVRLAKKSRNTNKIAGRLAVDIVTGLDQWAGEQLPLVFKDIAKAAKEAGIPGITVKGLQKASDEADKTLSGGGLLRQALEIIRAGSKTNFTPDPF